MLKVISNACGGCNNPNKWPNCICWENDQTGVVHFINKFKTLDDAIEFEERILLAGSLPDFADSVVKGEEPDEKYWSWLIAQVD
jgi:hypothetical protein